MSQTRRRRPARPKKATTAGSPPERGAVNAAFDGTCPVCTRAVKKGSSVRKVEAGWAHLSCAEFESNRQAVLDGRTFAGHKPSDWRRGQSPSGGGERRR
jgi:hypothetical protein